MKLVIDGRWVRTDYHDGISRYTAGLVEGFVAAGREVTVLICDEKQLAMLPEGVAHLKVNQPVSVRELFLARRLNDFGADVVFSPLQVMGFWGRNYRLVLTLQDIIYYHHPKPPTNLPWYVRLAWRAFYSAKWPQRLLLNQADLVATVSETSKKFIRKYRLTKRDIVVVYNAPSIEPTKTTAVPTKNIVYMGSFMPYKNVETLIAGMNQLSRDYVLHMPSKIAPARQLELEALAAPGVRLQFHNGISDEAYAKLLRNAHCLATATKEEGFGLPVTEAQKIGTPVVCSDLPVLHEVAGEGALYFSPDDSAGFVAAVRSLEDPLVREQSIVAATAHSAQFSWQKSAEVLYAAAKKLYDKPQNV